MSTPREDVVAKAVHPQHATTINPTAQGCPLCPGYVTAVLAALDGLPATPDDGAVRALRDAIDSAHEERRAAWSDGRGQEQLTIEQHWGATAGWLAARIAKIEKGDEPDWPDAMNTAALAADPADTGGPGE